jgi:hypothetical protein
LAQWEHWAQLRDALNSTGRPIYFSICPKMIAPNNGTAAPYAGTEIYSAPLNWTMEDHRTLSNSWLVEYRNVVDNFGPESDECVNAGGPCGFVTNVDAVVQMTNPAFSGPHGWNDAGVLTWSLQSGFKPLRQKQAILFSSHTHTHTYIYAHTHIQTQTCCKCATTGT